LTSFRPDDHPKPLIYKPVKGAYTGSNAARQHFQGHTSSKRGIHPEINSRHQCDGQIFQWRYKLILIDTDSCLLQAVYPLKIILIFSLRSPCSLLIFLFENHL